MNIFDDLFKKINHINYNCKCYKFNYNDEYIVYKF